MSLFFFGNGPMSDISVATRCTSGTTAAASISFPGKQRIGICRRLMASLWMTWARRVWGKLPDIAASGFHLWGRRPESAAAVIISRRLPANCHALFFHRQCYTVPSAVFPPRSHISHLFKYSVSMFVPFYPGFQKFVEQGITLMHPRHCRNVPRRRFRYRFRST